MASEPASSTAVPAEAAPEPCPAPRPALDLVLELHAGHLLRRAHHRARRNISALLRGLAATPTQCAALVAIGRDGPLSPARLGRLIGMEPPNVHALVLRLERHGFIRVEPAPDAARRILLRLTATGEDIVRRMAAIGAAATEKTLAPLAPEERAMLIGLLQRIV